MVSGEADIKQSLAILFSTGLGERIMQPDYGTALSQFAFRSLTATLRYRLKEIIAQAILDWEPRITVENITIDDDPAARNRITITVTYRVDKTNTRSNFVYPFYLTEATLGEPGR
jgi:hypothetical protein